MARWREIYEVTPARNSGNFYWGDARALSDFT